MCGNKQKGVSRRTSVLDAEENLFLGCRRCSEGMLRICGYGSSFMYKPGHLEPLSRAQSGSAASIMALLLPQRSWLQGC